MSTRAFRTITLATALVLAALIPALFLSTPAQAQAQDIVRIVDVFSGTQTATIVIVLEYETDTFNQNDRVVTYPVLYVKPCENCNWAPTGDPRSPKKVYNQPNQIAISVPLPPLCASTEYGMRIKVGEPDDESGLDHGFGFTSIDGPTIGDISGTVDGTTANVFVSINNENYSQKAVYLRYRVYGVAQWTEPGNPDDDDGDGYPRAGRNQVEYNLTDLTNDTYYEIEASMGKDFMSCTVIKAIGAIGSPTGDAPPAITTPAESSIIANYTYHYHNDDDHDDHHDYYKY